MTKSPSEDWFGEGRRRKKKGIDLVGTNNSDWLRGAVSIVSQHAPAAGTFLAEEFKKYPGIGKPSHQNAWGALTNRLKKLGVIEGTDKFVQATGASNHAHRYELYRRTPGSFSGRPGISLPKIPWTTT